MRRTEFTQYYTAGSIVISPYGLSVVTDLHDEPLKERLSQIDNSEFDHVAATLWVNGGGEETIEVDKLVPATPLTLALWQFTGGAQ